MARKKNVNWTLIIGAIILIGLIGWFGFSQTAINPVGLKVAGIPLDTYVDNVNLWGVNGIYDTPYYGTITSGEIFPNPNNLQDPSQLHIGYDNDGDVTVTGDYSYSGGKLSLKAMGEVRDGASFGGDMYSRVKINLPKGKLKGTCYSDITTRYREAYVICSVNSNEISLDVGDAQYNPDGSGLGFAGSPSQEFEYDVEGETEIIVLVKPKAYSKVYGLLELSFTEEQTQDTGSNTENDTTGTDTGSNTDTGSSGEENNTPGGTFSLLNYLGYIIILGGVIAVLLIYKFWGKKRR